MFGPDWPNNGEVDILEGVNRNSANVMSLHSGPNCMMSAGNQSGTILDLDCDGTHNQNSGCGVTSSTANSYGSNFNYKNGLGKFPNSGGVYATEWTSDHITTWFFPRGSIPSDITNGTPNPSGWGKAQSSFVGGSGCDIDTLFSNMQVVFDTTFCGSWASGVWPYDSVCAAKAPTCADYVAANPATFKTS